MAGVSHSSSLQSPDEPSKLVKQIAYKSLVITLTLARTLRRVDSERLPSKALCLPASLTATSVDVMSVTKGVQVRVWAPGLEILF